MDLRCPQALMFDFGSTILNVTAPNWSERCARLLELSDSGATANVKELAARAQALDEETWSLRDRSPFEYTALAFIRLLAAEFLLSFRRPLGEVERAFYFAGDGSTPTRGVGAMLRLIRSMGIRTAIISNHQFSGHLLAEHLGALEMGDLFEFVVSSADYGIRKPNPRIFEVAARRLGVRPDQAWYAGDTLEFDVAGARAAGMTPVWYRNGAPVDGSPAGVVVVQEWSDLIAAISEVRE